ASDRSAVGCTGQRGAGAAAQDRGHVVHLDVGQVAVGAGEGVDGRRDVDAPGEVLTGGDRVRVGGLGYRDRALDATGGSDRLGLHVTDADLSDVLGRVGARDHQDDAD